MNPIKYYLDNVHKKSQGYRPTWLPHIPVELGAYGIMEGDLFMREGNIYDDFDIEVIPFESPSSISLDFSSESGISITTKLKGKVEPKAELLGKADAGFIVEFSNDKGYVCKLKGITTATMKNLGSVKNEILERYKNAKWDRSHVIINELITADSATILVCGQSGVKVEIKADVEAKAFEMDIADAELGLHYLSANSIATQIIGNKGITPLFRIIGVKRNLFKNKIGSKGISKDQTVRSKDEDFEIGELERIDKKAPNE